MCTNSALLQLTPFGHLQLLAERHIHFEPRSTTLHVSRIVWFMFARIAFPLREFVSLFLPHALQEYSRAVDKHVHNLFACMSLT